MQAVSDARCVFDMGREVGFSMYLLDIGCGFSGSKNTKLNIEEVISVINPALEKFFPSNSVERIIAEPGRYDTQFSHSQSTSLAPTQKGRRSRPALTMKINKPSCIM
jgi:diaminopimelate decarboxylase